jgi:hypothetical protein
LSAHSGALEAVERILNRGGDPEEVVGAVIAALHERAFAWVGVIRRDGDDLSVGPEAGERAAAPPLVAAVVWRRSQVAELWAQPYPTPQSPASSDEDARALLERIALLISPQLRPRPDEGAAPAAAPRERTGALPSSSTPPNPLYATRPLDAIP